jgi:hypothetical protein
MVSYEGWEHIPIALKSTVIQHVNPALYIEALSHKYIDCLFNSTNIFMV